MGHHRRSVQLVDSSSEPEIADDEAAAEVRAVDTALSLERDMERSLFRDLTPLEAGLSLYESDGISGNRFDTGAVGRIDVLAVDVAGDFVVVELKAGRADDRVCGQILRDLGWVRKSVAAGRDVRGIVVARVRR